MSISEELKKDVAEKNISAIRNDLLGNIPFDLNFSKDFKESLDYCLKNGISDDLLYVEHDGRELSDEVSKSNFNNLHAQLRINFSKERLEKIKEIGRKLYPVKEEKPVSQNPYKSTETHRQTTASSSSGESGDSGLHFGLFIGAAIGFAIGFAIGWYIVKEAVLEGGAALAIKWVCGLAGIPAGWKTAKELSRK